MLAKVREDLEKAGERPPLIIVDRKLHVECFAEFDTWYQCWQPDPRDNFEFDLVLCAPDGKLYLANSVDFDFLDLEAFFDRG